MTSGAEVRFDRFVAARWLSLRADVIRFQTLRPLLCCVTADSLRRNVRPSAPCARALPPLLLQASSDRRHFQ